VNVVIKIAFLCVFLVSFPTYSLTITGTNTVDINGPEGFVYAYDSSTITASSGADIAWLYGYDNSTLNINIGSEVSWLYGYDHSTLNIDGGDISWLTLYDESEVNISFVEDLSWLLVNDDVQVNIFGSEFSYAGGHLSGLWANGDPFSFWALEEVDLRLGSIGNIQPNNINLHVVPTPSSIYLLLIGIGFLLIRRRT
jgi:hypothetical protein